MEINKNFKSSSNKSLMASPQMKPKNHINLNFVKNQNNIKTALIISTLFMLVSIIGSLIFSLIDVKKRILTFTYGQESENIFKMNIFMIYLFLLFLLLINSYLVYSIYHQNDRMFNHIIFDEINWLFFGTQIFFAFPFILGILLVLLDIEKKDYCLIFSVSSNIIVMIFVSFYYRNVKEKKNLSFSSLINISIYISLIFCFDTYIMFYNLSEIISINMKNYKNESLDGMMKDILCIGSHSIYLIINIILITYHRDVIFSISLAYFNLAYLFEDNLTPSEELSIYVLLVFNVIAVIMTLCKYKNATFGYEEDDGFDNIMEARLNHKQSSVFNDDSNFVL